MESVPTVSPIGTTRPSRLRRTLRWPQLVMLGIGAIVGTGIYTLVGVGAGIAGPSLILTFGLAGLACMLAVLTYAEVATIVPKAGGAYAYAREGLGELPAWFVGWSLILEYSIACAAIAVGWSGYVGRALGAIGLALPASLSAGPASGGAFNVPATFISIVMAWLLSRGMRTGARVAGIMVALKLAGLALFVGLAALAFRLANLTPFMPYGFLPHAHGASHGTLAAAAIVFFAFFGFDSIATSAEETERPSRDVPMGLLLCILACTLIYAAVSLAALGAVPYRRLAGDPSPLGAVMAMIGHPRAALAISIVAVIALPVAILSMMYGQSRLLLAMARDGLLPRRMASVDADRGSPQAVIVVTMLVVILVAGLLPLDEIAALANAGTLAAFIAVPLATLLLRRRWPERERPFRCPALWLVGPLAILSGCALLASLPTLTLVRFLAWNAIGLGLYFGYGRTRPPGNTD